MFFQLAKKYIPQSNAVAGLERRALQLCKHFLFSFIGHNQKKIILPVPE
jgi:hypothetical protein